MSKKRIAIGSLLASATVIGAIATYVAPNEGTGPTAGKGEAKVAIAYADPGYGWKVPTICYGHIDGVKKGQTATMAECHAMLEQDIVKKAKPVLEKYVKVPVTVNQIVSLADAVHNLGPQLFIKKNKNTGKWENTKFEEALNSGQCEKAADLLMSFSKSNGRVLPGLVRRRAEERDLFKADCKYWKSRIQIASIS